MGTKFKLKLKTARRGHACLHRVRRRPEAGEATENEEGADRRALFACDGKTALASEIWRDVIV